MAKVDGLSLAVEILVTTELPAPADIPALENLVESSLRLVGAAGSWNVTVALMDDVALRALHAEFMGDDSETDVMTFPMSESSLTGEGGDIAISVDRAAAQGPAWGHSAWQEIEFLTAHGVLHLCGWDDHDDEERAEMLALQAQLISDFKEQRSSR
jgi:probable rRNA maturation factor